MLSKVANGAAFQLAWWAAVLGAASSKGWIGPAVAACILSLHVRMAADRLATMKVIGLVGGVGYLADSALGLAGVLEFHGDDVGGRLLAPLWLLGLWLVFATTLGSSWSWLSSRPRLAAVLGAVFGPVSYYAGVTLGALDLGASHLRSLFVVAIVWSLLLPLSFRVDRYCASAGAAFRRSTV
ncbi:MAG: DUF2878 domain-containing protein [Nitrospira sp.]|nr:DUF2878 domain-containing protein [Nitrospira sp.]